MATEATFSWRRVKTVDGWRAIAIAGTLTSHWGSCLFRPDSDVSRFPNPFFYSLTRFGGPPGVALLFALSGFLITLRLLGRRDESGRINLRDFFIRRLFRLLPTVLAYFAVLGILIRAELLTVPGADILSALFAFRNYRVPLEWYTAHFWTLAVEAHFYLTWPVLLSLLPSPRSAWKSAALVGIAVGCWRLFDVHLSLGQRLVGNGVYFIRTDTRIDFVLWGAAAAALISIPGRHEALRKKFKLSIWMVASSLFLISRTLPIGYSLQTEALVLPLLILGTVLNPDWAVSRALETPMLRLIGKMSFSLYVWQQLFLVGEEAHPQLLFPKAFYQSGLGPLAAIALCAFLSYRLVEQPFLGLGGKWIALLERKVRLERQCLPG